MTLKDKTVPRDSVFVTSNVRRTFAIATWLQSDWTPPCSTYHVQVLIRNQRTASGAATASTHILILSTPVMVGLQTFMCLVCNVSLCRVKCYDGKSCHELFHSSITLVDYCRAAMDEVVHVVPHLNQPGPPNWQRATSSAIADNSGTNLEEFSEDDERPRRSLCSRVTPVIAATWRRHYVAHLHGPRGRIGQERAKVHCQIMINVGDAVLNFLNTDFFVA